MVVPDPFVTPAAAKIVIDQVGPASFAKLQMLFRGKRIAIVGPAGAGKTTFTEYMHYGVFDPPQSPEATIAPQTSKNFKFTLGKGGALSASVKRATDMPGQPDPKWIARETFRERPHGLIVMLDVTAPLDDPEDPRSTGIWLRRFCRAAELATQGMRRKNRLRTVVVALNKADEVSDLEFREKESRCREILEEHWRASAPDAPGPRLLKCVSVAARGLEDGTGWIDAVLSDLAIGLKEAR